MNYNNAPRSSNHLRIVLAFVLCLLVVGGIVYMKHATAQQKDQVLSEDSAAMSPVIVPDTTADPTLLPTGSDTVVASQLPDTVLGIDRRQPYEAGYEDGYATGCDDGAAGAENATYDESNNFRSHDACEAYVRGYREGYEKGFNDGKEGKQFNI